MIQCVVTRGRDTDRLSKWVANRIWPGKGRDFGNCQAMAIIEGDTLLAGMIWHNWEPDAGVIEISGAGISKRWLNRQSLRMMFAIPFDVWDCQAIVMRVPDEDKPLHRMLTAYGFESYRIPRLRGRDRAENVFVLTEENWASNKFNVKRNDHGQAERAEAA